MKKLISLLLVFVFTAGIAAAEMVIYNTQTGKYHKPSCLSAKKCTVNCIKIDKKEAKAKGGIPCKRCGG